GGRGIPPYGPPGEDFPRPHANAMERGWGPDDGGDDGGEWGAGGRGGRGPPHAPPPVESEGGFQEWSAFDESPPRAAPPRRAPMVGPGGRGRP
ncbi:unnamed protein product, partial [Scytosiphon promiscuus]